MAEPDEKNLLVANESTEEKLKALEDLALNMGVAHSLICREYLNQMDEAEIIPLKEEEKSHDFQERIRLFKITSFIYDWKESITEKLNNLFAAVSLIQNCNLFMILNNHIKEHEEILELYMGVSGNFSYELKPAATVLERAIRGNFPGCKIRQCYSEEIKQLMPNLTYQNTGGKRSISSISADAVERSSDGNFIQGMEKFADAMHGVPYTLMIVASPIGRADIMSNIQAYRELYTQLSPYKIRTETFNESFSSGTSISLSQQLGETLSRSKSYTHTLGTTDTFGTSPGRSKTELDRRGTFIEVGAAAIGVGVGAALGAPVLIAGLLGHLLGKKISEQKGYGPTTITNPPKTKSHNEQEAHTEQEQRGIQRNETLGQTINENLSKGQSFQVSTENKYVSDMLQSIDRQIIRMNSGLGQGAYNIAAYVFGADSTSSKTAAGIYGAILSGKQPDSVLAINTWDDTSDVKKLSDYLIRVLHPRLRLLSNSALNDVTLTTFVPCNETPLHFFWPHKSVSGLPVSHQAEFARSMPFVTTSKTPSLHLGKIFHLGREEQNSISLTTESLTGHICIAGSPGSGKSNLVYHILTQLLKNGSKFLVIEPAKGEYSQILGGYKGVTCLSTRQNAGKFLSLNPFAFPYPNDDNVLKHINALEHIEALVSLLESCWPMYAAMRDILKDAVIRVYDAAGWDVTDTGLPWRENYYFPTFQDLMKVLPELIEQADYSGEVKSNYKGSLLTRVKSMTNGLNRKIFSKDSLSDEELFNGNVLADISGITSSENLALFMGLLIIRLNEFRRIKNSEPNQELQHVTILEEAHNLLAADQTPRSAEGGQVVRKAVQLFNRAIAEMRSSGESFIIVDQTPSLLESSVMANTATKIVFNLQNSIDSLPMGRAMSLTEEQTADISTLEQGVCIVRSRGWSSPVQIRIPIFDKKDYKPFHSLSSVTENPVNKELLGQILSALILNDVNQVDNLTKNLLFSDYKSTLLLGALRTLREEEILSQEEQTDLFKNFFDTNVWFTLPKKANIQKWDLKARKQLTRSATLTKSDQDKILQALLTDIDKSKTKNFLHCWIEYNKTTNSETNT